MPGPIVDVNTGPPNEGWTPLFDYDVSGNTLYVGKARSTQPFAFQFTVSSVSTANPAVITITAHGLQSDQVVTISGATGDWAALNGSRVITATGADTVTVAVNSSAFTGSFDGIITTRAPRTNSNVWSIQKYYYTGSNNSKVAWCNGVPNPAYAWDSRTTYAFQ